MEKDAELMDILRGLDDPGAPEWPVGYSGAELAAAVGRLAARLGSRFSTDCAIEPDQDSAEYCRAVVPGPATVCGTRIAVLVSNFSPLVMVAAENRATTAPPSCPSPVPRTRRGGTGSSVFAEPRA